LQIIKTYPLYLQKEIKLFYSVIATAADHRNVTHSRLPDGTLDVVLNLGEPVYLSGDEASFIQMPDVSLTGLYHDKRLLSYDGSVHLIGAVFNPGFAHLFIKDNLTNYEANTCDASFIFGNDINDVTEQMHSMHEEKEKHLLLEKFLISRLQKQKDDYYLSRIALAIKDIHLSKGNVEIRSLGEDYFIGERNFRRKFIEYVGISPKKYASIIRVKAFCKLYKSMTADYQNISDELEYTDKSHLYKDFRKIIGTNPTSYFTQLNTFGNEFIDLI
jgi:AraC-like DNA-binding protein